ncbi:uncharacterized protein N7515_007000 [Penicillium bovifimosum]|uniref:Uncharacterized protein n=1 Tax=Penicillium bovifimosum TaxID=126998 RepID=A0A9W9GX22_9EURO|nr:uncharacterized protein N7515_007000 [Penicillium bovifimosum]KAJ5130961.1 hypothetical protein N7515_007000 [Penicillium bovifimosum]
MWVALTKHYRLASASHKAALSGLKPASDASAGLNYASTPNFAGLDHIRDSLGEDDAGNLLRDSTRSPPKEDSISNNLLEISDLSDTDDLPATPVSIREGVLAQSTGSHYVFIENYELPDPAAEVAHEAGRRHAELNILQTLYQQHKQPVTTEAGQWDETIGGCSTRRGADQLRW